jgi:hypothetical protein
MKMKLKLSELCAWIVSGYFVGWIVQKAFLEQTANEMMLTAWVAAVLWILGSFDVRGNPKWYRVMGISALSGSFILGGIATSEIVVAFVNWMFS